MKGFRKLCAIICTVAMVVSSFTVYATFTEGADANYDSLEWVKASGTDLDLAAAAQESFALGKVELLGDGRLLIEPKVAENAGYTYPIWPDFSNPTLNGKTIAGVAGAGIYIPLADLVKDSYNVYEATSNVKNYQFHIIIRYGNVSSGGSASGSGSTEGGQKPSSSEGQQTTEPDTSGGGTTPPATALPKKAAGLNPQVKTDTASIDNSVLLAWASVMEPTNPEYDASVYTYNCYVYQNGVQIMKVCNVTNGCILGGLSAGTYGFSVAAVNAMGEGPKSDMINATITGFQLNYTPKAEYNGPKIPAGFAIVSADPTFQSTVPEAEQKNSLRLAWAASNADAESPSYDLSVTGYNVYVFDAETGKPYRRVHVDGIESNTANLSSVSAGKYVAFVTAVNSNGESGMAAPGLTLASSVEIKGDVLDNAQDFDYPDTPALPLGLVINGAAEGVGSGFSIAWSPESNLNGVRLNVFVDGICVKAGANSGADPTYHEMRIKPGTYEVSVTAQYISNNAECVPLTKTITVAGEGTNTPQEIADSAYTTYEKPTDAPTNPSTGETATAPTGESTDKPVNPSTGASEEKPSQQATDKPAETTAKKPDNSQTTTPANQSTAPNTDNGGKVTGAPEINGKVPKAVIKKVAPKKRAAKKIRVTAKKLNGINGYQVKVYVSKKNAKADKKAIAKKVIRKNTTKLTISGKKLKNKKKLFVRIRAYKNVAGKKQYGAWSKIKRVNVK